MVGHEELGITEILDGSDRKDDPLAGSFGGFELPIKLTRVEDARSHFDVVPVGRKPNQVEWIG